jgi:hypothetical protein
VVWPKYKRTRKHRQASRKRYRAWSLENAERRRCPACQRKLALFHWKGPPGPWKVYCRFCPFKSTVSFL